MSWSVNVALLSLFVLLAPGLVFLNAFFAMGRLTRYDYQRSIAFDLATLVSISVAFHMVVLVVVLVFLPRFSEFDISRLFDPTSSDSLYSLWQANWQAVFLDTAGYLIVTCVLAAISGVLLIRGIERGNSRIFKVIGRRTHGRTYYALIAGKHSVFKEHKEGEFEYLFASVVTNCICEPYVVAYAGVAHDIVLGPRRQLSSLTLRDAWRFSIDATGGRSDGDQVANQSGRWKKENKKAWWPRKGQESIEPKTPFRPIIPDGDFSDASTSPGIIVIPSADIKNVAFTRKRAIVRTDAFSDRVLSDLKSMLVPPSHSVENKS